MKLSTIANDIIQKGKSLSSNYLIFAPKSYMAFTEDSSYLAHHYPHSDPKCIRSVDLPSYSDKSGSVILLSNEDNVLDRLNYYEGMHVPYIDNAEGISLERISPLRKSDDVSNWTSAASAVNYATPGAENSQYRSSERENLTIHPSIFSPDNDGYNDFVEIHYHLASPGALGNINIYNKEGIRIRSLIINELLAMKGSFIWKGIDDWGNRVPLGYYIVEFDFIELNGNVDRQISTVVVATVLN